MEEEETEKVDTMVKPKPSFTPRRMQMAGETADAAAKRVGAAATGAAMKKVEAVYTPASEALLEVRSANHPPPLPPDIGGIGGGVGKHMIGGRSESSCRPSTHTFPFVFVCLVGQVTVHLYTTSALLIHYYCSTLIH